jgi:hypothetical protein
MTDFKNYLILAGAGIVVTLYKIFKSLSDGTKLRMVTILSKVLLALIISLLVVPRIMEWFDWDINGGLMINALLNLFSEGIMVLVEKELLKKIKDKIEKI